MKHQKSALIAGSIAFGLWSACSSQVVTNASSTAGASGDGDVEAGTGGMASPGGTGSAGRNSAAGGTGFTTSGGTGYAGRPAGASGAPTSAGQGTAVGATSAGGGLAKGGAGVAGAVSKGGTAGAAGIDTGGSSTIVGGAPNAGRTSTGGAATGGAANAGRTSTGGAATGGAATGGAATGGAATGGAAIGGAATGGAATGGAAATETVVYSFYDHLCDGDWVAAPNISSGASVVQCGVAGANPSVTALAVAALQGGTAGQRVIRLQPYAAAEGLTSGYFAGISLIGVANPAFVADVACPSGATNCAVDWQIYGRLPGTTGAPAALQNGSQSITGATATLRLSLAACANIGVDINMSVDAGGTYSTDDVLLLVNPRIISAP